MSVDGIQEISGQVATLAVPASLGFDEIARFGADVTDALANDGVRIVVLRGDQQVFCQGMNLSEISVNWDSAGLPPWEGASREFAQILLLLRESRPATVAVVEGAAMGGGVGLAAVCDLVVATDSATFALPELLIGVAPAIILPVLGERLGLQRVKRWAMTQETWKSSEAKLAGLVDQILSAQRLESQLERLLRSLMRAHPRGLGVLKGLTREMGHMDVPAAVERGRTVLSSLLSQMETRSDLIAFRDYGLLPGEADA